MTADLRELANILVSRDSSPSSDIPAPINVSPSEYWDGNDGPWSSFPLQLGTPAKTARAMISTAGYITWVVDPAGCPSDIPVTDCDKSRGFTYQANQSVTWVPNSVYDLGIEQNLGMRLSGSAFFDTLSLGWDGPDDSLAVNHSTIYSIVSPQYWIGGFGINPRSANFTHLLDPQPSFMYTLKNQSKIPSLSYGYTAGNQYRLNGVFGSLVLGGYDQNRFQPTTLSHDFYGDISRDLIVNIHSITTEKVTPTSLLPDGSVKVFIDSTVPMIYLPESACGAFEQAFGLSFDNSSSRYLINDTQHEYLKSTNAAVTFTIGNETSGGSTVDIILPYGAFDLEINYPQVANKSRYFPLMRANSPDQYTLGRTFLQEAYLITDYERGNFTLAPCTWDPEGIKTPKIHTITDPRAKAISTTTKLTAHKPHYAVIAGAVVGGIAAIVIFCDLLFFFKRQKSRQRSDVESEQDHEEPHQPSVMEKISQPFGGELSGYTAIHEADTRVKLPHELESSQNVEQEKQVEMEASEKHIEMDSYQQPWRASNGWVHEVDGKSSQSAIYEMPGSDVVLTKDAEGTRNTSS